MLVLEYQLGFDRVIVE